MSSSSSPTGCRSPTPRPSRSRHGPRVLRQCFEKAKEQVIDLLLLVEVGRLELPCPAPWDTRECLMPKQDPIAPRRLLVARSATWPPASAWPSGPLAPCTCRSSPASRRDATL